MKLVTGMMVDVKVTGEEPGLVLFEQLAE